MHPDYKRKFIEMTKKRKSAVALMRAIFVFVIIPFICSCSNKSSDLFEQFAYYKRDNDGAFNYRIFVYITNATPQQMEEHAKKQMWSSNGTTMVCYFNSSEGLNADAITLAANVDAAIDEVWRPSLVARYMHWPTGKEDFLQNPYRE